MSLAPLTGARRLREQLKDPDNIVVCPGVFDGLTARLALAAGFDAIYMVRWVLYERVTLPLMSLWTGAGTSISRLGWADLGIATLPDMRSNAEMIASLSPSTPVIADADTGYGGPIMVSRTVTQYARSGVAALHIEDQAQQKRCGHLLGKELVDRETYYSRLRAAVAARDHLGSDILIIARTDARQTYGVDEAIARLEEAVKIGVDVVFFEAIASKDEARQICQTFKGTPVLLNMVPGGVTPNVTVEEAKELGFRMIIFPGLCIDPIIQAVSTELQHLKDHGTVSSGHNAAGVKHAFNVAGLQECIAIDKAAGGKAYDSVGE